jgi:hypothetical protein
VNLPTPTAPAVPAPGGRGFAQLVAEAVHIWLANLWPLAVIAALIELPLGLVSLVPGLAYGAQGPPGLLAPSPSQPLAATPADTTSTVLLLVTVPVLIGLTAALEAVLYRAIAEAYTGRRPGLAAAYRAGLGRLRPLLAKELILVLMLLALAFPLGALAALAGFVLGGAGGLALGTELLVGMLGAVAAWLLVRLALASPAIVTEGLSGRESLRRSAILTRGRFWRTFSVIVVTALPNLAVGLLAGGLGLLPGLTGTLIETAVFVVVSAFLAPLPMCATLAVYYEYRRAEAGALSIGMTAEPEAGP